MMAEILFTIFLRCRLCQKDKKSKYRKGNLAFNNIAYKKKSRGCLTSEFVRLYLAGILYFKHYSFITRYSRNVVKKLPLIGV
jgi:hypothetical protein